MTKETGTRLLGEGWTLGVWRRADGRFVLGIPVSAGIVSSSFDFEIDDSVLSALAASPRKTLALYVALHDRLQSRLVRGAQSIADRQVHAMIAHVAALDERGLDDFVSDNGLGPMMAQASS